jgi:hypothetical protein
MKEVLVNKINKKRPIGKDQMSGCRGSRHQIYKKK